MSGAGAILVLGAIAAGGVYAWARDLYGSVRDVTSGATGEDAMRDMERRLAMVDVVVLAALADGSVTEEERQRLDALRVGAADAISTWERRPFAFETPDALRGAMRAAAASLSPEERAAVLQAIVQLRPGEMIDPTRGPAYRDHPHLRLDVVALAAEALGIDPESVVVRSGTEETP